VLLPQISVATLGAYVEVTPVRGLVFKPGYDLFRLEDSQKIVAGGTSVRKAPPTAEAFVVVVTPARGSATAVGIADAVLAHSSQRAPVVRETPQQVNCTPD